MNTQEAGQAEIEAIAVAPNGQNLPLRIVEQTDDHHIIEFTPNIPGQHKLNIMYGGEPAPGSPLLYGVSSSSSGLSSGKPDTHASGTGLEIAHRGKEASFVVHCANSPNVQIERLDEHGDRIEPKIKPIGTNEWKVCYTVMSVGKYEIRASSPTRGPLPGSPWTIACVDASKVVPVGGWGSLLDNDGRLVLPARFVFDTTHAGPGELLCSVDGQDLGTKLLSFKINHFN